MTSARARITNVRALEWILLALVPALGAARPAKIDGRQLIVDGRPLHVKGVCWNPVPKGGVHPADLDFRGFVAADAELMARGGINAVRTYSAINDTDVLDVLWEKGIHVLNTVYIWGKDPIEDVVARVNAVKHHPAILMWVVGNEWNYNGMYVGLPFPEALQRVKDAVDLIKQHDQDHPVATVHGELPSAETLETLQAIDAWGINKYSGASFGNLFDLWQNISSKPMFLGEYGADAYDSRAARVDEPDQAKATRVLTEEITQHSSMTGGVSIGGIIFEFADEWWKDGSGNPSEHDVGGVSPGGGPYPDLTFNEEWWGLMEYDGTPRQAFWEYADAAAPGCERKPKVAMDDGLRRKTCGAHHGCRGRVGFCCPNEHGDFLSCCTATTTPPPTPQPAPSTTWRPARAAPAAAPAPSNDGCGGDDHYIEQKGMFANGHFGVDTQSCEGVGECQFKTRKQAQAFCDATPTCVAVLRHPFEENCAGGFGCYTPRYGALAKNSLWDRSGGKAWAKSPGGESCRRPADRVASAGGLSKYAFIGFHNAIEAQSACRPRGRLAMPKNASELQELQAAVVAAQAAGKLTKAWPQNTIWLGGQYNPDNQRWMWDDGTPMDEPNWAAGQPSAAGTNQMTEPWLCMVLGGEFHDSDPPYEFGVFCELEKMLEKKVSDEAAGAVRPATSQTTTTRPKPISFGDFVFMGFASPKDARDLCGPDRRVAMPTTPRRGHALARAVQAAKAAGHLTDEWPHNTLWLGGKYRSGDDAWRWDDGTRMDVSALPWGPGQPSAVRQRDEPWLSMLTDGSMNDSPAPHNFGVMCEPRDSTFQGERDAAAERAELEPARSSPPAPAWHYTTQDRRTTYTFAGYTGAQKARVACAEHGQLAMPKTSQEHKELRLAIREAVAAGQMTSRWPNDTIWLGGKWSIVNDRWEWDDGTVMSNVNWAENQPSAKGTGSEPWVCMVSDGGIHDSDSPYAFGAMCERRAKPQLRKMLQAPTGLQSTIALGGRTTAAQALWS